MANITNIDHGQANWDDPLNQMLAELGKSTADTGWINITLLNGFKNRDDLGKTSVRKIGNLAMLRVSLTNLTENTIVGNVPLNFRPIQNIPFSLRGTTGKSFSLTLGSDCNLSFEKRVDGELSSDNYIGGVISWFVG